MNPDTAVTIVLLAGGKSTRLPGKLALPIGNEAMLVKVYKQLTNSELPCIISVRERLPDELTGLMPSPTVRDKYQDSGPLGGLASAAEQVTTPLLFAAAGDLPNIDGGVVATLLRFYLDEVARIHPSLRGEQTGPQAVVPRQRDGQVEPLAALYDTAALLSSATRVVKSGRRKVTDALEGLNVVYYDVPAGEQRKYLNVNTPLDFARIGYNEPE
jgi:molybdopterin-guanine dinucleotide biosynthesis protein A